MSVNKYVNGKLLQVSGNADTRLTSDDIATILGYTPVNPDIIGATLATLNESGKLTESQKPSYSWSEITGKPSTFTPSSHTHRYAGSSSAGGAATSALALTTARTLTIGNSGKTFDGSTDVSWSLSEIGAASQSDLDILNSNINNRHFIYISATDIKETFEINIGNNNIAIAVASREGTSPAVYIIYQIADKAFYYKLHDESNLISLSSNSNLLNITLNLQWTVFRYFVI